jgi:uridine phosphorylase
MQELDFLVNVNPITCLARPKLESLHIVRLGTTGALRTDIVPGQIITSHGATGFDTLMQYYAMPASFGNQLFADVEMQQTLGLGFTPYTVQSTWGLLNVSCAALTVPGHTATCPGFYGPQSRNTRLQNTLPLLDLLMLAPSREGLPFTNFEMETAGIFALGVLMGHHTASLNLVVANRASGQMLQNPDEGMADAIELLLGVL